MEVAALSSVDDETSAAWFNWFDKTTSGVLTSFASFSNPPDS
jgi:hypothetical protein